MQRRVVWAYADWSGKGQHDLATSTWQLYLLVAGVLSWMKFAPTYWRVMYVDKSVYEFLKEKKLLELYNEVIVVDFHKEIKDRYKSDFFAFPKMWAYTQQEDPFFICDTDVILTKPLNEWFDDTKYWGWLYNHTYNLPFTSEREPAYTREGFLQFQKTCMSTPGLRGLCDFTNCVNGGLIYFPDPQKAQILGYTMLSLAREIDREAQGSWVLYEEALIPTILEKMGVKMTPQPVGEDCVRIEECGMGSLEEYQDTEQYIKDILGFDLKEWYPFIKF